MITLHKMEAGDNLRYNNNPTDKKSFLEFQKRQLELSKQTENQARKMKIASNVDRWEGTLPNVLRNAKPGSLPKSVIEVIRTKPLKPPYNKQLVISASNSTVSTFVAYSIIYGLIQGGIATPSEIKKTSLLDGYNNINGMFESRKWKDHFFDKKAKVLLIEGGSKSLSYLGPKGEDQFWKELNDFTRNEDRLVIVTYQTDEAERERELFVPILTSDSELNKELVKKSVFVPLLKKEEEEIEIKQGKAN